jgi:ubiquinone/menaquinone biosynthesis C-methylase UbiE
MSWEGWTAEHSRKYAETMRSTKRYNYKPWARILADDIRGYIDSPKIADIACGPGFLSFEVNRLLPRAQMILVDKSAVMLTIASAEARAAGVPIETIACSAERMSLGNSSVQVAISKQYVHEMSDINGCFDEMQRILQTGGRAYVIDYDADGSLWRCRLERWRLRMTAGKALANRYWHSVSHAFKEGRHREEIVDHLRRAGFKISRVIARGPNYCVVARKS